MVIFSIFMFSRNDINAMIPPIEIIQLMEISYCKNHSMRPLREAALGVINSMIFTKMHTCYVL